MKVLHIISGLNIGGAEMMLFRLLSRIDKAVFETEVVSLTDIGPIGQKIQALGIRVRALEMRRGVPNPIALFRFAHWLWKNPPHVIQTWMYHADLFGGLAAKLAGGIPIIWGIHHCNLNPQANKKCTIWAAKVCAHLSHLLPTSIICCSEASKLIHITIGYASKKMMVIPNGFDLDVFKPDPSARLNIRQELGIPKKAFLIGVVGRFHPQKDYRNFIQAAARLHKSMPDVHFLLCGESVNWENEELSRWITKAGILNQCHLLGQRDDIPRVIAALEILSSSSCGEGFSIVIGEAMASGVPCVVTNVGDSAYIVGDTGLVVSPRDPCAMTNAWFQMLTMSNDRRHALGMSARQRIVNLFAIDSIKRQYEKLYCKVFEDAKREGRELKSDIKV